MSPARAGTLRLELLLPQFKQTHVKEVTPDFLIMARVISNS